MKSGKKSCRAEVLSLNNLKMGPTKFAKNYLFWEHIEPEARWTHKRAKNSPKPIKGRD
jgi:hypothetical protein